MICELDVPEKNQEKTEQNLKRFFRGSYECKECPEVFPFYKQLQDHEWFHMNKREYQCHKCIRSYDLKKTLRNHMKQFHPEDVELLTYDCKKCPEKFPNYKNLQRHLWTHR